MTNQAIEHAKNAIQQFLNERPASADTAEGIHRWWIRWTEIPESIEVTLAALEQLKNSGVMESVVINQHTIWRKTRQE